MKNTTTVKLMGGLALASAIVLLMLIIPSVAFSQQDKWRHEGFVQFFADPSLLSLPKNVHGLVFDTTSAVDVDTVPTWRLLGNLKLDSLVTANRKEPLEDSTQLSGVAIGSTALRRVLERANILQLERIFPSFDQADTLYWDSIRQKWHQLPDLSRHYIIHFSESHDVDNVLDWLRDVPKLAGIGSMPIETTDADPCSTYVPNDQVPLQWTDSYWTLDPRDDTAAGGIGAICAWGLLPSDSGAMGRGIQVAIVDDGVLLDHVDLVNKLDLDHSDSATGTHGTRVAGVLAAETFNFWGIAGAAPLAELICINHDRFVGYAMLQRRRAVWYAISDTTLGTDVLNISWGFSYDPTSPPDSSFFNAMRHAKARNIAVVASSGNRGIDWPAYDHFPAGWDSLCIAVGGTYPSGNWSIKSNWPPDTSDMWLDVVAPGWGSAPLVIWTTNTDGSYLTVNGTSFAAPLVAGMMAIARGIRYDLTPEYLEELLEQTANRVNWTADSTKYGWGRANAYAFIDAVLNTDDPRPHQRAASSLTDSIPYLIITSSGLESYFKPLAERKTRRGTNTAIVTTSSIYSTYSGSDNQEKIRACIEDYYDNKHLEYVLLGGDGTVVPYRYAYNNLYGPGVNGISDFYYACLDGDWNYDSDTLWGETEDSLDLEPEVAVGRLPFSSSTDVTNFIGKLADYESGSPSTWQTKVLSVGSQMFRPDDGQEMGDAVLDYFPQNFTQTVLYDTASGSTSLAAYFSAMNAGQGILLKHGLSRDYNGGGQFWLGREHGWIPLYKANVDTLSNDGMPSVVYSVTCWGHQLDEDCMAEHYMEHADGGAVAYIGATHNDFSAISKKVSAEFFDGLFGTGPKEIGKLLNVAKETMLSKAETWDGPYRHTMFGYALSGDPQMRIWTATPQILADSAVDILYRDTNTFNVEVTSGGQAVEDALVCVKQGASAYEIAETNGSGIATFTDIVFDHNSIATVAVTKHNYVAVEDTIDVLCCLSRVGDANCIGGDEPTIGDVSVIVDALFITGHCDGVICCLAEADMNQSGGADPTCSDITIGDLSILQDYLFISQDPDLLVDCY